MHESDLHVSLNSADDTANGVPIDVHVQPIQDRIQLLDVLRAFALLGIYISIIHSFNGSILYGSEAPVTALDVFVGQLESLFINKRFIGILSLLFGIGIAIQQDNFKRNERPFASYFLRRMAVLAVFGLVNTTFYFNGEILLVYAVLGALMLVVSKLPLRLIFALAAFSFLVPAQIFEAVIRDNFIEWFRWFPEQYPADRVTAIYRGTDYLAMIRLRWLEYAYIFTDNNFHLAMSFAMILWGYVIGVRGIHREFPTHLIRYVPAFAIAAGYTTLFSLFALATGRTDFIFLHDGILYVFYAAFMLTSMFTYIFLVTAVVNWLGSNHTLVQSMANNGKLCLSGYMGVAVAYSFIFYGYGLGWYMKYSNATLLVISLIAYASFTVFSSVWLRFFRRGPMEWVYRRLSYGKLA